MSAKRPEPPRAAAGGPFRGKPRAVSAWLGRSRLGLVVMALVVGALAGLAAVGFRELVFAFTWIASGHEKFGQQGRVGSVHLPWLGIWFLLVIPIVGGLVYGPLIQRFAREARGHGVPEVMVAVAENGGRIRPPVTVVKALASAICIGSGGSVGREGPIVQIGSALASSVGQLVRMSEGRLRILVACGAAGGIAATFNAPITGLFFGFEIVLRELSLDALFAVILSAFGADLISRAFFGSGPFFGHLPHGLLVGHDYVYLLIALLGVAAGLLGAGFKATLYRLEDSVDALWRERPESARPVVGGLALGALLLALPQLYGVGYPVVGRVFAGQEALWFVVVLMAGKVLAASLTLSIGGSGGVFGPSLFIGAFGGMAYGTIAHDLIGPAVGPAAVYAVVAMGAVFAAAAQAPLTAIASVVEMTGNFSLILSVMLAAGIAAALAKRLSYGSIYTTKLLRRGIDIERARATGALEALTVADAMQPLGAREDGGWRLERGAESDEEGTLPEPPWDALVGPLTDARSPQALFADEDLGQALRQLVLYGRDGLPVVSHDGGQVRGWLTRNNVLRALDARVRSASGEIERGALAAEFAAEDPAAEVHTPSRPLRGYRVLELTVAPRSAAAGRRVGEVPWPAGCLAVAVTHRREIVAARADTQLVAGERVIVLAPSAYQGSRRRLAGARRALSGPAPACRGCDGKITGRPSRT